MEKTRTALDPLPKRTALGTNFLDWLFGSDYSLLGGNISGRIKSALSDRKNQKELLGKLTPQEIDALITSERQKAPDYLMKNLLNKGEGVLPKGNLTLDLNPREAFEDPRGMIYQAPIIEPAFSELPTKGGSALTPWRSKLGETVAGKMPAKMPAAALAQQIRGWNLPGEGPVTSEQIEWSGLDEWLKTKGKNVEKKEVMDYLKENDLQIEEVVKGKRLDREQAIRTLKKYLDKKWSTIDDYKKASGSKNNNIENFSDDEIISSLHSIDPRGMLMMAAQIPDTTKFSQYQLPGGENYREMLIKLPSKLESKYQEGTVSKSEKLASEYHSSHWDEPNVLAHVRFNDHTGPNGERVLFIEELQSDWHQKGRKEGYKISSFDEWAKENHKTDPATQSPEDLAYAKKRYEQYVQNSKAVPDAPWKKTWPLKAFQRMVRYAAENGYDSISWTPGEVQADRYDLSKIVSRVEYIPETKRFRTFDKNGDGTFDDFVEREKLEDYIGKEPAKKLYESMDGPPAYKTDQGHGVYKLDGLDLKVGGEGMKGFYDKILPAEVNKFFNKAKWGKAKVGTTEIDTGREFMGKGTGRWEIVSKESGREEIIKTVEDRQEARDFAKTLRHSNWVVREEQKTKGQEVWTLPITPEMKEKALGEGFWSSQIEQKRSALA